MSGKRQKGIAQYGERDSTIRTVQLEINEMYKRYVLINGAAVCLKELTAIQCSTIVEQALRQCKRDDVRRLIHRELLDKNLAYWCQYRIWYTAITLVQHKLLTVYTSRQEAVQAMEKAA